MSEMERTIKLGAAMGIPKETKSLRKNKKPCIYYIARKMKQKAYTYDTRDHYI